MFIQYRILTPPQINLTAYIIVNFLAFVKRLLKKIQKNRLLHYLCVPCQNRIDVLATLVITVKYCH